MERQDRGSLATFAVVAEERSFTCAAARLGVSPSALSHTMRRLEERLHVQLLARSTRSVSTTNTGERLLARLRPAIDVIFGAVEELGRVSGRPSGRVQITASRTAARMVRSPLSPARMATRQPDRFGNISSVTRRANLSRQSPRQARSRSVRADCAFCQPCAPAPLEPPPSSSWSCRHERATYQ